jgi:hypothetical protein
MRRFNRIAWFRPVYETIGFLTLLLRCAQEFGSARRARQSWIMNGTHGGFSCTARMS